LCVSRVIGSVANNQTSNLKNQKGQEPGKHPMQQQRHPDTKARISQSSPL
jgi:hypothetical protein